MLFMIIFTDIVNIRPHRPIKHNNMTKNNCFQTNLTMSEVLTAKLLFIIEKNTNKVISPYPLRNGHFVTGQMRESGATICK